MTCDFIVGLLKSLKKNDYICVVEDRLTKLAHFIPVKSSGITKYLAKLYTDSIV